MIPNSMRVEDCKVCLGAHDEEVHDATLGVREWFRGQVTKHFEDYEYAMEDEAVAAPAA